MFLDQIKEKLEIKGIMYVEKSIPYGVQLKTIDGCIINVYNTGTVHLQGRNTENIKKLLEG